MNVFAHNGHCGDLIAALPTIRALGGGRIIITNHPLCQEGRWRPMRGEWGGISSAYESIRPLLQAQEYVDDVAWSDHPAGVTHDLQQFRSIYRPDVSLVKTQADFLGVSADFSPWLSVDRWPSRCVIFSRTARHHSKDFPWSDVVKRAGTHSVFLGTEKEWSDFTSQFGYVDFVPTENLLQAAQYIAGSRLFVGNPSALSWIAVATDTPIILECETDVLDAIVPRENAVWFTGGSPLNVLSMLDKVLARC